MTISVEEVVSNLEDHYGSRIRKAGGGWRIRLDRWNMLGVHLHPMDQHLRVRVGWDPGPALIVILLVLLVGGIVLGIATEPLVALVPCVLVLVILIVRVFQSKPLRYEALKAAENSSLTSGNPFRQEEPEMNG